MVRKKRAFEKEHWYVTNIDHLSLKAELGNGQTQELK
jgi:hypothetical protein